MAMALKLLPVDLDRLIEAMEWHDEMGIECIYALNLETGEIISFGGDVSFDIHDPPAKPPRNLPDWQLSDWQQAREYLNAPPGRFEDIPNIEGHDDYDLMEQFIEEVPDPRLRDRLARAIAGKGAFRRFKDELSGHKDAWDQWSAFKDRARYEAAEEWLEELGIQTTWTPRVTKQKPADWKPKIVCLHHAQITVPKGQEQAARDFYCGILGLAEIDKPASLQSRGGFWLGLGDIQIHIGVEEPWDRSQTKAHLAYQVTDIAKWRDRLEKAGCKVLDSIPIPGFDRFEFRDPFGNRVEMIQPSSPG